MWLPSSSLYVLLTIRILMPGYLAANRTAFVLTAHDLPPPLAQAPPYAIYFVLALRNSFCFSFGLAIRKTAIGITPFLYIEIVMHYSDHPSSKPSILMALLVSGLLNSAFCFSNSNFSRSSLAFSSASAFWML